ncbi:UNVERIFIED_CONTAM: hypothetical protein Sindi_1468700 [Sesamum indicum]
MSVPSNAWLRFDVICGFLGLTDLGLQMYMGFDEMKRETRHQCGLQSITCFSGLSHLDGAQSASVRERAWRCTLLLLFLMMLNNGLLVLNYDFLLAHVVFIAYGRFFGLSGVKLENDS